MSNIGSWSKNAIVDSDLIGRVTKTLDVVDGLAVERGN